MFIFRKNLLKWPAVFAGSLLSLSLATAGNAAPVDGSVCQTLPVIKNLTGMRARVDCQTAEAISPQFNSTVVRTIRATTESSKDRVALAQSLRTKGDKLDAEAAGYEQAATRLAHGPFVKNLMAPTTAGRYDFYAKRLREEAKSNRDRAAELTPGTPVLPDDPAQRAN
jgi:hypothetical protein